MRNYKISILTFLTVFVFNYKPLFGQKLILKGKIVKRGGQPIEFINVSLLRKDTLTDNHVKSDSVGSDNADMKAYITTDSSGNFSFENLKKGHYKLLISHTNFQSKSIGLVIINDTTINISVDSSVHQLQAVTVEGQKPLMERKLDRIIYNVGNTISNETSTTWEQISRIPGIRNMGDENLMYNNQSIRVLMNDKIVRMTGEDLAQYLKSIPSNLISRIEVITSPPAKYEASGSILLNIIYKKRMEGISGTYQLGYDQGKLWRLRNAATLNIQKGKIGISANYSLYNNNELGWGDQLTQYPVYQSVTPIWRQHYSKKSKGHTNSYRMQFDYFINRKNTLDLEFSGINNRGTSVNNAANKIYNNVFDSTVFSKSLTETPRNTYIGSFTYNYKIDSAKEKQLYIYGDYTYLNGTPTQRVNGSTTYEHGLPNSSNDINFLINTKLKINLTSLSVDYTSSIFKKVKLETGMKYSNSRTENALGYYSSSQSFQDTSKSNRFIYSEKIYALYFSLNGKIKKIEYKAGLRGEYTNSLGQSPTVGESTENNYFKIFPSIVLGTNIGKKNSFNLSYDKSVSRPEYFRLNPFKYYGTTYEIYVGNPFLKPSITQRFELGYTYNNRLNASIYYSKEVNSFQQYTFLDSVRHTLTYTHVNFGKKESYGIYTTYSQAFTSFWELNFYGQLANQIYETVYLNRPFKNQSWRVTTSLNNTFKLSTKYKMDAELNGWYETGGIQGIFRYGDAFSAEAFLRKKFGNHWSTSIGVTNIFFRETAKIMFTYEDEKIRINPFNDTRQFRIGIMYRFGIDKDKRKAPRKKSGESERNRM